MGQKKSQVFFSNAEWSEIGKSYDSHGNFEMAKDVCLKLLWDYGNIPCKVRGYCKKVWVTDNEGYLLFEKEREDKFIPSYAPEKPLTATDVLVRKFKDCSLDYIRERLKDYPNYPEEHHKELLKRLGS
jgi:hypothetical protein